MQSQAHHPDPTNYRTLAAMGVRSCPVSDRPYGDRLRLARGLEQYRLFRLWDAAGPCGVTRLGVWTGRNRRPLRRAGGW